MPWSISRDGEKYLVTKEGEDTPLETFDSRTDAIKYQRSLYAEEERASMVAALTYEPEPEPEPEVDTRLDDALARLDAIAEKEEKADRLRITVGQDPQVMDSLIATINQISERLEAGERVSESLVASLQSLAVQQPPVVNVEAPIVNVPETVVHIPAPVVNVEAPNITIPEIVIPPTEVTVVMPDREKKVTFVRDPMGRLEGAEVTEE